MLLGTWLVRAQIFDTDTGLDVIGFDEFNVTVDPGAFQVELGEDPRDVTLVLFGDMQGAAITGSVGSCADGEAEWTLGVIGGAMIDVAFIDISLLDSGVSIDWDFEDLDAADYEASLRYIDGTPQALGELSFARQFTVPSP